MLPNRGGDFLEGWLCWISAQVAINQLFGSVISPMRMRTSAGVGGKGRRFEERTRIPSTILLALPVLLRDEVASRACAGLKFLVHFPGSVKRSTGVLNMSGLGLVSIYNEYFVVGQNLGNSLLLLP